MYLEATATGSIKEGGLRAKNGTMNEEFLSLAHKSKV
jgi:hypothetical protein